LKSPPQEPTMDLTLASIEGLSRYVKSRIWYDE
jgi:hypothetical protein